MFNLAAQGINSLGLFQAAVPDPHLGEKVLFKMDILIHLLRIISSCLNGGDGCFPTF
ncbi:TPA_asm: hypothetical protein [ssRNA phage Esthiorhiza.2_10]|uniref:Uncharacterized protein n=2 Tax=Leviviricetes TaxID=2842243 RepID=A0A8S5KXX8_9VIRU|nr:hypothetical protein QIP25_gp3 [ssRNA phage Esthiorhiza.2_10]QDH87625.1 MAG: hypothetical protein H2RhizoLitter491218_000003 [Leviviridae sp.]DAD49959.1 TPA_asm: hypothetical protein [ssRNA phage Esthiorhiza.2_10]